MREHRERRQRWGETGRARRLPAVLLLLAVAVLAGVLVADPTAAASAAADPAPGAVIWPAAERPVLLSFAEALVLSEQVSAWLATQARVLPACRAGEPGPCLPRVDGAPAALRLPSAAEWEYAARGAPARSIGEMIVLLLAPCLAPRRQRRWFIVPCTARHSLQSGMHGPYRCAACS